MEEISVFRVRCPTLVKDDLLRILNSSATLAFRMTSLVFSFETACSDLDLVAKRLLVLIADGPQSFGFKEPPSLPLTDLFL